jgi:hypothetical protein
VVLDGAIGTELIDVSGERPEVEEHLWGITTIVEGSGSERLHSCGARGPCTGWTSRARACAWRTERPREGGRAGECAIAFSINGDVDTPDGQETIRLLARVFEDTHPA